MERLSGAEREGEIRALALLDRLPGVGLVRLRVLVDAFGSARRALAAPAAQFARLAGPDAARQRGDPEIAREVDGGLASAARLGMRICTWRDELYPAVLWHLTDPPPVLFLRGRAELLGRGGVAVVGARRATARAHGVAERLGAALGRAGVPVVSGLALGVDGAAHRGALRAGGDTVAVLGRGADAPYPRSHARLFSQIVERGLVVSEFLPGTPAQAHHFPRRNRILAALAHTVVVVEAGPRSGALITVDHALDLGLDVWAVPGPIDSRPSEGSNRLLAEGARALVSIEGFVREIAGLDAAPAAAPAAAGASIGPRAPLASEPAPPPHEDPDAGAQVGDAGLHSDVAGAPGRALLASLASGPLHVDELAGRAGLDVPAALALLTTLELGGAIERLPGMFFRRAA